MAENRQDNGNNLKNFCASGAILPSAQGRTRGFSLGAEAWVKIFFQNLTPFEFFSLKLGHLEENLGNFGIFLISLFWSLFTFSSNNSFNNLAFFWVGGNEPKICLVLGLGGPVAQEPPSPLPRVRYRPLPKPKLYCLKEIRG